MGKVLLNNYLPQLWANLDDDKISAMCDHIRQLLDHIEYGNPIGDDVDGQRQSYQDE